MNNRAPAAFEPCGCTAAIAVLGDYAADAYAMAVKEAKAGRRIEEVDIDEWKARPLYCADHTADGPPWWKRNGGTGKAPAEYAPQPELGL